jgi:hypothetical protein
MNKYVWICKLQCYTVHYIISIDFVVLTKKLPMLTHKHYIYMSSTCILDHIYIYTQTHTHTHTHKQHVCAHNGCIFTYRFMVWLCDWCQILRCMHGPLRSNPVYFISSWYMVFLDDLSHWLGPVNFPTFYGTQMIITFPTRHNSELTQVHNSYSIFVRFKFIIHSVH